MFEFRARRNTFLFVGYSSWAKMKYRFNFKCWWNCILAKSIQFDPGANENVWDCHDGTSKNPSLFIHSYILRIYLSRAIIMRTNSYVEVQKCFQIIVIKKLCNAFTLITTTFARIEERLWKHLLTTWIVVTKSVI